MGAHRLSLFRTQFFVEIFPQHHDNRFTFHSFNPRVCPRQFRVLPAEQRDPAPGSSASTTWFGEAMTKRGGLLTLLAILVFGGFLLWSTLSSQRVECTVTVAFKDVRNSATASAATESDATREAQTAACGPLAQGMNEAIACGRIPPVSRQCRNL